ncbi:hypothetical protein ACIP5Y_04140 [Nocardia sp. NPDC088792]|uniref:hypothetical protein n=1 Tax=Nocardia sp. NPDC088792 TaxID=3364332 RepID=UPI00380C3F2F
MRRITTIIPTLAITLAASLSMIGCSTNSTSQTASTVAPPTTTAYDTVFEDAKMIASYNETHPGTFDKFNSYRDKDGQTFQFFDANGNPNMDVIKAHRNIYESALLSIIPNDFEREYYAEHGYK